MKSKVKALTAVLVMVLMAIVVYSMITPVLGINVKSELKADTTKAVPTKTMKVQVEAKGTSGKEETVFLLYVKRENAGLADKYEFKDDVAKVGDVQLHRIYTEDRRESYWFSLGDSEEANFDLECKVIDQSDDFASCSVYLCYGDDLKDAQQKMKEKRADASYEPVVLTWENETEEETTEAETTETETTKVEETTAQEVGPTSWKEKVDKTTVKASADAGVLPKDATLVVKPITNKNDISKIKEAIESEVNVEEIKAFDISFTDKDGKEIQPDGTVNVQIKDSDIDEDSQVYHVDDKRKNVEDMKADADTKNVAFDTTHFSTYAIINTGDDITVTINHMGRQTKSSSYQTIYKTDVKKVPKYGSIPDIAKATNWTVDKVEVGDTTYTAAEAEKISLDKDATVTVYYTAKSEEYVGQVSFYDYITKGNYEGKGYSINQLLREQKKVSSINDNALIMGNRVTEQNYSENMYSCWINDKNANQWVGGTAGLKTGILKGLDADSNVEFNYPEPGFFVKSDATVDVGGTSKTVRKYLTDYTLKFDKTGDSYKLNSVYKGKDKKATAGANFFPLDGAGIAATDNDTAWEGSWSFGNATVHNWYFGMRYDVKFTIGDYVGALNYSFTGDDDLWVVLDGKKIVIDLGGIHDALSSTVDLWKYIGDKNNLTEEQRNQEHTLTILYMERGGNLSNCNMEFTLPSAKLVPVDEAPLTNITINKVNKQDEALNGAKFKLVNQANTNDVTIKTSNSEGKVTFDDLAAGTYTLTETEAPDGYLASTETWIVKVTADPKDSSKVVAKLYASDGETEVTGNKIVNYTNQELVDFSMDYDKTATVKDWDKRTYDIDITAASKMSSSSTVTKGGVADVMLVLDVSGSMDYNTYSYSALGKYSEISLNTSKTYYCKVSDSYVQVKYRDSGWGWESSYSWQKYVNNSWQNVDSNDVIYQRSTQKRLAALKNAVNTFITDTEKTSPTSKIGATAFSSSGYGDHGKTKDLATIKGYSSTLTNWVNKLTANGGTDPVVGLTEAYRQLKKAIDAGDTIPKYVILFTDGEPTGGGNSWNETAQEKAETKASELKKLGVTVYTVGFALTDKASTFLSGGTYSGTKYPGIASPGCAFEVDDMDGLMEIFKAIQSTITNNYDITGATVTDIVDDRFVILDDNGNVITNEMLANGKTVKLSNGGVVSLTEDGKQQVVWSDVTIPNKENKNGAKQWKQTITVKAKETYIGGNNIPTNDPRSDIKTSYGDVTLPQPHVNVKADLLVNNNETTIYYGDKVPTKDEILNQLFDKNNPTGMVDGKKVTYTIGTDGNAINPDDFTLEWYKDADCTEPITVSEMGNQTPAPTQVKYYLKVTYNNLGDATTESNKNTKNHIAEGTAKNVDDSSKEYGIYTINIISGEIEVVKNLSVASNEDQTFNFTVKNEEANFNQTVQVTIKAGQTKGSYKLSNLKRGTYKVEEAKKTGYAIKESAIGSGTNCENHLASDIATFIMGNNTDSKDVIVEKDYSNGILGIIAYTNEPVNDSWGIKKVSSTNGTLAVEDAEFTLTSTKNEVIYGKTNAEGIVLWYTDSGRTQPLTDGKLPKGTYTLVETKAPNGYALSNETWTVNVASNGSLESILSNNNKEVATETVDKMVYYKFENTAIYELPNSGGMGTYLFTISGVAILMTALLLFIQNKKTKGGQ